MDARYLADSLLRAGGRTLWAELAGGDVTRRPRPVSPRAIRDTHCEGLLLGAMLTYTAARRAAVATGLQSRHFSDWDHAALYATVTRPAWQLDSLEPLTAIRLIDAFADAANEVSADLWREWSQHYQGDVPHVDAALAAQGLAERVLRLALAREHLMAVNQLLAGRNVAVVGRGGVTL